MAERAQVFTGHSADAMFVMVCFLCRKAEQAPRHRPAQRPIMDNRRSLVVKFR
jgi:hypothetical protein